MLIKSVIRKGPEKGTAVPYTPEEAAVFAVERGVKLLSTQDTIYWVLRKTIKMTVSASSPDNRGDYTATATGTAEIGTTDVKTDRFYAAKAYNITVSYKSGRDAKGLPDIELTQFESTPVNTDSRALALQIKRPKAEAKKAEPKPEPKKEAPKAEEKKAEPKAEEKK